METEPAVTALAALAQATRLRLFRLLAARGPQGLTAGDIAAELRVPPNTLSFHLSHLVAAGLIEARREGRFIRYAVIPEGIRDLLAFLSDDCCGGRPDLCGLPPRPMGACTEAPESPCASPDPSHPVTPDEALDDPRR